jgi:hypothetical protein
MRDRLPLPIALALIALAVLVGSLAIGRGIRDRGKNDVVTVTGSAKQRITSDYVVWNFTVAIQEFSAAESAAKLAPWTRQIRAFHRTHGSRAS